MRFACDSGGTVCAASATHCARITREEARPSSSLESRITYPRPGQPRAPRPACVFVLHPSLSHKRFGVAIQGYRLKIIGELFQWTTLYILENSSSRLFQKLLVHFVACFFIILKSLRKANFFVTNFLLVSKIPTWVSA